MYVFVIFHEHDKVEDGSASCMDSQPEDKKNNIVTSLLKAQHYITGNKYEFKRPCHMADFENILSPFGEKFVAIT